MILLKTKSDEAADRLSELPESLILHILSLLKMRDAVRTSVLSKYWADLWTSVPCLDFNEYSFSYSCYKKKTAVAAVATLIDRVLLCWRGTKILNFKIDLSRVPLQASSFITHCDMDSWLRFATEKKVESLEIRLPFHSVRPWYNPPAYRLPQCLYSSSSITELKLTGFSLEFVGNVKVQWFNLKTLHLEGLSFSEDVINQVVSSAPKLEELDLRRHSSDDNLTIKSNSLKSLVVVMYNLRAQYKGYDPSKYTNLTIWAPKLEALHIEGHAYSKCLLMDVSSVTRASLYFYEWNTVEFRNTLMKILPEIQHVESLALSPCLFQKLGVMEGKYSPFWNVKTLKFWGGPIERNEIVGLAEIFQNVETLQIHWNIGEWHSWSRAVLEKNVNDDDEASKNLESFWMQLRRVEVTLQSYEDSIFVLINFLMKHAAMVEEIVIREERKYSDSRRRKGRWGSSLQRFFPTLNFHTCYDSKVSTWRRAEGEGHL